VYQPLIIKPTQKAKFAKRETQQPATATTTNSAPLLVRQVQVVHVCDSVAVALLWFVVHSKRLRARARDDLLFALLHRVSGEHDFS
jgi:hypothetical protein